MYCESGGKMGFKIYNLGKRVTEIQKEKESLKLIFADSSEEVVRQAMVVYTREEEQDETTEKETEKDD